MLACIGAGLYSDFDTLSYKFVVIYNNNNYYYYF